MTLNKAHNKHLRGSLTVVYAVNSVIVLEERFLKTFWVHLLYFRSSFMPKHTITHWLTFKKWNSTPLTIIQHTDTRYKSLKSHTRCFSHNPRPHACNFLEELNLNWLKKKKEICWGTWKHSHCCHSCTNHSSRSLSWHVCGRHV